MILAKTLLDYLGGLELKTFFVDPPGVGGSTAVGIAAFISIVHPPHEDGEGGQDTDAS